MGQANSSHELPVGAEALAAGGFAGWALDDSETAAAHSPRNAAAVGLATLSCAAAAGVRERNTKQATIGGFAQELEVSLPSLSGVVTASDAKVAAVAALQPRKRDTAAKPTPEEAILRVFRIPQGVSEPVCPGGEHERKPLRLAAEVHLPAPLARIRASHGEDTARLLLDGWRPTAASWHPQGSGKLRGVWWCAFFATPQPVSSLALFWSGAAPNTVRVEVACDPLPDLAAAAALSPEGATLVRLMDSNLTDAEAETSVLVHPPSVPARAEKRDADKRPRFQVDADASADSAATLQFTWRTAAVHTLGVPDVDAAAACAALPGAALEAAAGHVPVGYTRLAVYGVPAGAVLSGEALGKDGFACPRRITALRILLEGTHAGPTADAAAARGSSGRADGIRAARYPGVGAIQLFTHPVSAFDDAGAATSGAVPSPVAEAVPAAAATAVTTATDSLAGTAMAVAAPDWRALDGLLRAAAASGSQADVLRYIQTLLLLGGEATSARDAASTMAGPVLDAGSLDRLTARWGGAVEDRHRAVAEEALKTLSAAALQAALNTIGSFLRKREKAARSTAAAAAQARVPALPPGFMVRRDVPLTWQMPPVMPLPQRNPEGTMLRLQRREQAGVFTGSVEFTEGTVEWECELVACTAAAPRVGFGEF
jgi:hypothetical protein